MKCKIVLSLLLLLNVAFAAAPVYAQNNDYRKGDWSDLDSGEHEYYGSEKDEKMTDAFIASREKWDDHYGCMMLWLFKYTDYPKYSSTRLLPFYYSRTSKIDNRSQIWFLPYYSETDGPWSKLVLFPVYRSTVDIKKNSSDRSLLYLFWWGDASGMYGASGYRFFTPFVFYTFSVNSDATSKDSSIFILPLLYREGKRYQHSSGGISEETNMSLLHFYHSSAYTGSEEKKADRKYLRWFAPIIPLIYYNAEPGYTHVNLLWLIDHSWKNGKLDHSWFLPLWIHEAGEDGFTTVLPPLYIHNRYYSGEYYWHLLPFAARYDLDTGSEYNGGGLSSITNERGLITPLFGSITTTSRNTNGTGTVVESDTFWSPLLYYKHYSRKEGTHRNVLGLFDWKTDTENKLSRLWIPLYLFKNEKIVGADPGYKDQYRHVLPVFYSWGYEWKNDYAYSALIGPVVPLFHYRSSYNDADKLRSLTTVTPLWYYNVQTKVAAGKTAAVNDRTVFFPIVPVLWYSHSGSDGAHRNLLMLFDWASHADGSADRFWLNPLVYHKFGDGGYRYYLPFYFRPSGWTEERGVSFGPLHYHRWSKDESLWLTWLHYGRKNTAKNESVSSWLWLYYSWNNISLFGQPASHGRMILPIYFSYEDSKRYLHVNILGGSKSTLKSPAIPDISLGLKQWRGGWYIDSDISWLYNVFSVSLRKRLMDSSADASAQDNAPVEDADISSSVMTFRKKDQGQQETPDLTQPALVKRKTVSRENSDSFLGVQLLFGLSAFEMADSKRHIRVFPLAWFTWDKNSDDKILANPFFFKYRSDDIDYAIYPLIPPVYAHAKDKESAAYVFLFTAFWYEHNYKSDEKEFTVLWPFINFYYSPERSGWRLFPFVWHKNEHRADYTSSWTINPLYYRSKELKKENGLSESRSTLMFPVIPLYYRSEQRNDFTYASSGGSSAGKDASLLNTFTGTASSVASFAFPLYYYTHEKDIRPDAGRQKGEYTWYGLPFLYNHTRYIDRYEPGKPETAVREDIESTKFYLGYYSHKKFDASTSFFFPLFYRSDNGGTVYTNILGLYNRTRDSHSSASAFSLHPFVYYGSNDAEGSITIPPLLYYHSWGKTYSKTSFLLSFWKSSDYVTMENRFHILPFYYSRRAPNDYTYLIFGTYWHRSQNYSRQNIYYLFDHKYYAERNLDVYDVALGNIRYEISPEVRRMKLVYGMLMDYSSCRLSGDYDFSLMWFMYNQRKEGHYFGSNMFPLWYYERYQDSGKLIMPPLLTYTSWTKESSFQLVGLGSLWYRNLDDNGSDGRQMLLLGTLWNEVHKPERGYASRGMLWGFLWDYETEEETGYSKFTLLKFLYKRTNRNGEIGHKILGIDL